MTEQRVALVTGASRGIGRGCALHLARAGFDVVIAARTMTDDERPQKGVHRLPGTLEATAADIKDFGREALPVRVDLLDRASYRAVVDVALSHFGRVDVLVNNGLYANAMKSFEDTPIEEFEKAFTANVIAPLELIQLLLPHWKSAGRGLAIGISSGGGQNETASAVGAGGWPLGYSMSKAAFNRMAAGAAKELQQYNVAVVNIEPGFVATEQMVLTMKDYGLDGDKGIPVEVPAAMCAYIAAHPTPMTFSGRTVDAPQMTSWMQLVDHSGFPYPYGPSGWGFPPRIAVAGATTGIESGMP